jgi:CubicO group peptidase (beta-lactamase class C family)
LAKGNVMQKIIVQSCFLLLFSFALQAGYIDSKTPLSFDVAERTQAIIELINSKDRVKIKSYIESDFESAWHQQIDESVNYFLFNAHSYGKLTFHSYRYYQPELPKAETVAILYAENAESWVAATIITSNDKISILDISPAKRPSNIEPLPSISEQQAKKQIGEFLNRTRQRSNFSGNVLVARNDQIWVDASMGEANKRYSIENNRNTRFNLASVSKMFVGVAIGILVDDNKLQLGDKVSQFLGDEWIDRDKAKHITIAQLLSHQSGLANNAFNLIQTKNLAKHKFKSTDDFRQFVREESYIFEAGKGYAYSNTGLVLAGVIIEKVTGMAFDQYIQQAIFESQSMERTGYYNVNHPVKDIATGYEQDVTSKVGWLNNTPHIFSKGTPAGGAYATSSDMHRFLYAFAKDQLLKPTTTHLIKQLYQPPTYHWINHSGLDFGVGTHVDLHQNNGLIVVTLSNHTNGAVAVASKIRMILEQIDWEKK